MERPAVSTASGTLGNESSQELIETVRNLITMMGKGGITELDLATGDLSIRLRGHGGGVTISTSAIGVVAHDDAPARPETSFDITAPMIGTFYSAPTPGESPFVQVGDDIEVGQVVGIIEAMKIMNEIIADRAGVVVEVLVENAQAVEYGSPLIRLGDASDALA
jgi:biotin carboxyl carrier protein